MKDIKKGQVVIAYILGGEKEFNDNDYKAIDVVDICFAQIVENDGNFDIDMSGVGSIGMIPKLREKGIRVCVSLGGGAGRKNMWASYIEASKTKESRKKAAEAILKTLKEYDLDGIDMDWEYPKPEEKEDYVLFMQEIKDTLKAANPDYLITAAIPSGSNWVLGGFDLAKLNNILDYINVMGYDMDTKTTSFHSALYDSPYAPFNTSKGIEFFHENGADYEKLVLGMAFYGRVFTNVIDDGKGSLGLECESKSAITYHEMKDKYLSRVGSGVTEYYNKEWGASYLYDKENKVFICYDGLQAIADKCDYAVNKNLGGIMYWSYNNDLSGSLMQVIASKYDNLKHIKK